jgi:hypothetical protein
MNNRLLLPLAALLLAAVAYFVVQKNTPTKTKERDFAIPNTDQIGQIFLADHNGATALLKRTPDNTWTYNDTCRAYQNGINSLLDAISRIAVRNNIPHNGVKQAVTNLATEGVKVMLYDRKGTLLKSYYIGGSAANGSGTIAMIDGASIPMIINIPGWEGTLQPRFLPAPKLWRDRALFGVKSDQIASVSTTYPTRPELDFDLTVPQPNQYTVTQKNKTETAPLIKPKVAYYLKGFETVNFEGFESANPKRDSIVHSKPYCSIKVTEKDGKTHQVDFYPIFARLDGSTQTMSTAVDRYYANYNNKDFFLVQQAVISRLMAPYSFFFVDTPASK